MKKIKIDLSGDKKKIHLPSQMISLNPDDFIPKKGLLTRYGRKLLEEGSKYYETVKLYSTPADRIAEKLGDK